MISATPGREVRQELYLNHRYEKARQDVGLFYLTFRFILIMLILENLQDIFLFTLTCFEAYFCKTCALYLNTLSKIYCLLKILQFWPFDHQYFV